MHQFTSITPAEACLLAYPNKATHKILLAYTLKGLIFKKVLVVDKTEQVGKGSAKVKLGENYSHDDLKLHERIFTNFFVSSDDKQVSIRHFIAELPEPKMTKFKSLVIDDLVKSGHFEEGWLSTSISAKGEQKAKELRTQIRAAKLFIEDQKAAIPSISNHASIISLGACVVLLEGDALQHLTNFFQDHPLSPISTQGIQYAEISIESAEAVLCLFDMLDADVLESLSAFDSLGDVLDVTADASAGLVEGLFELLGGLSG